MKKSVDNNQYLCKAKRTDNGDWITRCLLIFDDEYRIATSCLQSILEDEPDAALEVCTYKVDLSTICRCVGIENKGDDISEALASGDKEQLFAIRDLLTDKSLIISEPLGSGDVEDKTGNLIWENDIIEKEFYTDYNAYANSEKYAGVIRWSSLRVWKIETERGSIFLAHELEFTDFKNHCKVVGNVFDNPELLEEIGIKKEPEEMEL